MSLYLSRLMLNPRSRQVMSEIAYPYEMHRTLMRAFPQAAEATKTKARDEFGVLFRAEHDDEREIVRVYVQSRIEPNWSILDGLDDYLRRDSNVPAHEYKDIMPACLKIKTGQILSFRLRANPTKRIGREDDEMKGKRVELGREDEQIDWLIRKGQGTGTCMPGAFDLPTKKIENARGDIRLVPHVKVSCEGKRKGRKREAAPGYAMTHLAVLFEGLLRVTDRDAFVETIVRGIGAGKAFGFGLLSFAPVKALGHEEGA
jgi:CRISPR system Cascade subunit CasE